MSRILIISIVLLCWKSSKETCTICDNKSCGSGGTSAPLLTSPGYECTCFSGFQLPNCSDIDECSVSPGICNNGSCVNTQGRYHCACIKGFTGRHCNNAMDACGSSPCKNGGTCSVTSDGSHVCKCYVGFNQSTECGDIDECNMVFDHNPCNNGTCVNTQGSFSCSCNAGSQGKFCRDDVDECLRYSCPDHTICVNTPGSYSCQCTAGYTGPHCQMDVDQCGVSPCRHGSCVNKQGSFKCNCEEGFNGSLCDNNVTRCLSSKCLHGRNTSAITDATANITMLTSTSVYLSRTSEIIEIVTTNGDRTRVSGETVTMETYVEMTSTNVTLVLVETSWVAGHAWVFGVVGAVVLLVPVIIVAVVKIKRRRQANAVYERFLGQGDTSIFSISRTSDSRMGRENLLYMQDISEEIDEI